MKWTGEKPTREEWYWWRRGPKRPKHIMRVDESLAKGTYVRSLLLRLWTPWTFGAGVRLNVCMTCGQWAGPIPEPEP